MLYTISDSSSSIWIVRPAQEREVMHRLCYSVPGLALTLFWASPYSSQKQMTCAESAGEIM